MDSPRDQQLILCSQNALVESLPEKGLIEELSKLFADAGHASQLRSSLAVAQHVFKAIAADQKASISNLDYMTVMIAALLHSADDVRLFPDQGAGEHRNARRLLRNTPPVLSDRVLLCLTSMRKTASNLQPSWGYPHLACKLEAAGLEEILVRYDCAQQNGDPLFGPDTPRGTNLAELASIAALYTKTEVPGSFVDLVYSKLSLVYTLLELTDNRYFLEMAHQRLGTIQLLLIGFGNACEGTEKAAISHWVHSMRSSMG